MVSSKYDYSWICQCRSCVHKSSPKSQNQLCPLLLITRLAQKQHTKVSCFCAKWVISKNGHNQFRLLGDEILRSVWNLLILMHVCAKLLHTATKKFLHLCEISQTASRLFCTSHYALLYDFREPSSSSHTSLKMLLLSRHLDLGMRMLPIALWLLKYPHEIGLMWSREKKDLLINNKILQWNLFNTKLCQHKKPW